MAPVLSTLRKVVTAEEIRTGRFHVLASVRDRVFPHVARHGKTNLTMVDENGESYPVVVNMRRNGTKPEIMSRGGRRFAVTRNLVPGAILEFSRSHLPGHFNVTVHPPTEPQPPIARRFRPSRIGFSERADTVPQQTENPAVLGLCGLSAQTQPPVAPHFPTFSSVTAQMGFGALIAPDHPPADSHSQEEPPTPMTLELGFGLSIGSDHSMGDLPKPSLMTMELNLGLSVGPVPPPSPAITPPGLSLFISSENMEVDQPPANNPEEARMLDLTLAIGTTHHPATPTPPELRLFGFNIVQLQPQATPEIATGGIKSEAQEVGWHPGLSLSLGSNILYDPEFKEKMAVQDSNLKLPEAPYLNNAAYLAAKHDFQEPKPPTSLFSSNPGFSAFAPYVRKGLFGVPLLK